MTSLKDALFTESDIIDPFWVIRYLENHVPLEKISAKSLIQIIRRMKRRHMVGIKVTYRRVSGLKDCFTIHGFYEKTHKKSIELQVCCSSEKKKFNLTEKLHRLLINEIADALCHESIHRYQFQFKDYQESCIHNGTEEQIYYSDKDEMFCFAVNIAHNLYRQYGIESLRQLQHLTEAVKFDPYLADYYSLFSHTKIFNKVIKMVYLNILAIDRGEICHRP